MLGVNLYQRLYQGEAKGRVADLSPLEIAVLAPIVATTLWLGVAPAAQLTTFEADVVSARAVASAPAAPSASADVAANADVAELEPAAPPVVADGGAR